MKCLRCGKIITGDCAVCPNCGFQVKQAKLKEIPDNLESPERKKTFCSQCGTLLEETDVFCPKCGKKTGEPLDTNDNETISAKVGIQRKTNIWYLAIPIILCIFCIGGTVLFTKTREPNFRKLYQTYCKTYWADVGSDGSYLYIDTNPQDTDGNGLVYPEAAEAIQNINRALGLPESVINEMGQTTFLDGKQTEIFEKQKISINWRYSPNKGLEVTYTKLK